MLINPSGEPLLAQLPYLLTSIACVVLDGMVRLPTNPSFLKAWSSLTLTNC